VIVGDAAVVKWATHLQEGPHPAPRRIAVLREAGFGGMPTPWGAGHLAACRRRRNSGGERRRVPTRCSRADEHGRFGHHRAMRRRCGPGGRTRGRRSRMPQLPAHTGAADRPRVPPHW
jgi:hypothetical protein